jgi:hypothetical protein
MIHYAKYEVVTPHPIVLSRTRPRLGQQRPQRRILSDDDVRAIRWWAAAEGAHLPTKEQRRVLQQRYGIGESTVREVVQRHTYVGIEGPPLSARRWMSPADQRLSLLMWLVWFLLTIRTSSTSHPMLEPHIYETVAS